jgi:hypothetical protein
MERYLSQMVREAIKVADEKKAPILEDLLHALGNMRWKAGGASSLMSKGPTGNRLDNHQSGLKSSL